MQRPVRISSRILASKRTSSGREIMLCLSGSNAFAQASHCSVAGPATIHLGGVDACGSPEIHVLRWRADSGCHSHRKIEPARHYADDGAGMTVDLDGAAYDVAIGIEMARPEAVTENHFPIAAGLVFFRKNIPAEHGRYAEGWEHVGGHRQTVQRFGRRVSIAGEIEKRIAIRPERCESARGFGDVLHIPPGHPARMGRRDIRVIVANLDQLAGVRAGHRISKDAFYCSKDYGGGADADSYGEEGDGCKSGTAAEGAEGGEES